MPATHHDARDPENMIGHVLAWPDALRTGCDAALDLPRSLSGKRQIVCCGMGGSAIGAGLAGDYLRPELSVPFAVVRDYDLPSYVDTDTLVVCISYSGGTEETLACYEQATAKGAAVVVIATGGELADRAKAAGIPVVLVGYQSQPRAALPYVLGLLLNLVGTLDYVEDVAPAVASAAQHLDGLTPQVTSQRSPARKLAKAMTGKVPIIYGAGFLAEAARRLKGQISENAKQTAAWETLPEQNHNALVGFEFPKDLASQVVFVLLRSSFEHPRHTIRFAVTKDLLGKAKLPYVEISGSGDDNLSHLTSVLFWGDLASVELAYANRVDPTPVDVISELKDRLAKAEQ